MQVTNRTHLQVRMQNTLFTVLLVVVLGLLAWLSLRYEMKADWTLSHRHSLSEASQKVLDELSGSLTITAYATKNNHLRQPIKELVERYQRHKSDLTLRFVDPNLYPGEVRERGVQFDGEIIIDYQKRSEHMRAMQSLSEQNLTTALQRVARTNNRLILFMEGHGERSPTNFAEHDLSQWAQSLKNTGFNVQTVNFGQFAAIHDSASIFVIASPRNQLLPGEVAIIADYINNGGNLLWFIDPSVPLSGLETLAEQFGLTIQPGMIADPMSQLLGVNNLGIVPVTGNGYGQHPVSSGVRNSLTLFPQASGLVVEPPEQEGWEETVLLTTSDNSWSETGELDGTIEYNEDSDIAGPLNIAWAMTREIPMSEPVEDVAETENLDDSEADTSEDDMADTLDDSNIDSEQDSELEAESEMAAEEEPDYQEQRVIIVGEGDFLSNAFIGFGGNLDLGLKMMNWLAQDDNFVDIPAKTAVDLSLELSSNGVFWLGAFFLLLLPLGLISIGISIWLRRRKA